MAYLSVIRDTGYYDDAVNVKSYETQLYRILYDINKDGSLRDVYCQPAGDYYKNALWAIDTYGFNKYDEEMFKEIEKKKAAKEKKIFERKERKRKKNWDKEYMVVYDENVPSHSLAVDKDIIKKGTVSVFIGYDRVGIYDVESGQNGCVIATSNLALVGKTVHIEVDEDAVG